MKPQSQVKLSIVIKLFMQSVSFKVCCGPYVRYSSLRDFITPAQMLTSHRRVFVISWFPKMADGIIYVYYHLFFWCLLAPYKSNGIFCMLGFDVFVSWLTKELGQVSYFFIVINLMLSSGITIHHTLLSTIQQVKGSVGSPRNIFSQQFVVQSQ